MNRKQLAIVLATTAGSIVFAGCAASSGATPESLQEDVSVAPTRSLPDNIPNAVAALDDWWKENKPWAGDDIAYLLEDGGLENESDEWAEANYSEIEVSAMVKRLEELATKREKELIAIRKKRQAKKKAQAERDRLEDLGHVFYGGTHRVGEDIPPGTYATAGGEGCYWERTDSSGNINDNNFITGYTRVQVTIYASDYSFTSNNCGTWKRL